MEDFCEHCGVVVPVEELTELVDDNDEAVALCIACTEDCLGGCVYEG